jgi:hypothetical protein
MTSITANDLKTKGMSVVEAALQQDGEAVITVRGERKYVVLDFTTYNKLREYQLDIALQEARNDVAKGNYKTEGADKHIQRVLSDILQADIPTQTAIKGQTVYVPMQ